MRCRPVLVTMALLLASALGTHELRYALAGGGPRLANHGHGYLLVLTPLSGWLCALALAFGLLRAAAASSARSARLVGGRRVWPAASAAVLAIYASQELLEAMFAAGHPGGWAGVFGSGGWI